MRRMLVIDDDASVGHAIEMMLAQRDWVTELAGDAGNGADAFMLSRFDAVMIDIFMPGMDGLKAIKSFRAEWPTVPIIAMSGFRFRGSMGAGPNFLDMAISLGATGSLRKPFNPQELFAAVDACAPSESGLENAAEHNHIKGPLAG